MRILETNLAAFITTCILDVKRGCYDAYKNGDLVLRLPGTVQFTCEVVRGSFNSITRTDVQTPATTQSDNSAQGGGDSSTVVTTYTQFSFTSP
jgi:hypothetical protein